LGKGTTPELGSPITKCTEDFAIGIIFEPSTIICDDTGSTQLASHRTNEEGISDFSYNRRQPKPNFLMTSFRSLLKHFKTSQ
jgi:hypothetical protein